MRRIFIILIVLVWTCSFSAKVIEKGEFDLIQNGINKGYEKYKVERKRGILKTSSEVRFRLPMLKAKRGYVELYLYPVLKSNLKTGAFMGYTFRLLYDDFSEKELVEAKNSAMEIIDQEQDLRSYDIFHRSRQREEDVMANRIDLGVNYGKVIPEGHVLHFMEMRQSSKRVKDERLPKHLTIVDSYVFCTYLPLVKRALAMKGNGMDLTIATPQGMGFTQGRLEYMGTAKTKVGHNVHIRKRFDINIKGATLSSFWVDRAGMLVEVVVPAIGLIASRVNYKPLDFKIEAPRIFKESVKDASSLKEKTEQIPSGAIDIGATLTLPAGKGPFPTILMVQDLEPTDRDGNISSDPYSRAGTWKQLAFYLASQGFATLRYDSRGVGETGGSAQKFDFKKRVGDCKALAKWLNGRSTTRPGGVIILAQGLGGWVAAKAAADGVGRALLVIGYPAKDLLRLWKEQVSTITDPQKREQAYNDLDNLAAKLKSGHGSSALFRGKKIDLAGVREIAGIDPLSLASSLTQPCLFVYPTEDKIVMGYHREILEPYLHAGQKTIALKGLDHQLAVPNVNGYAGELISTKPLVPISKWLKANFATKNEP